MDFIKNSLVILAAFSLVVWVIVIISVIVDLIKKKPINLFTIERPSDVIILILLAFGLFYAGVIAFK